MLSTYFVYQRFLHVLRAMGRMREELDLLSKGKFEEVLKSRQARIDELEPNVREKANLIGCMYAELCNRNNQQIVQAKELNNLRERTTKLVMSENLHKTSVCISFMKPLPNFHRRFVWKKKSLL